MNSGAAEAQSRKGSGRESKSREWAGRYCQSRSARPPRMLGDWPRRWNAARGVLPGSPFAGDCTSLQQIAPSCTKLRRRSQGEGAAARGCKTLSVNCLSSLRLHPSGVRRSEGERSEPSAAEPRRGGGAPRAKNWSRAGHSGFLLGCQQTQPTQKQNDPPKQS